MIRVAKVEEMRNLDSETIKGVGIPGLVLMENAGRGVVEELLDVFDDLNGLRVVIVCGRGNNGGDGLVVARYLDSLGAMVKVYLTSEEKDVKGDAKIQLDLAKKLDIKIKSVSGSGSFSAFRRALQETDVVIDAMLGTGAKGKLPDQLLRIVSMVNNIEVFKVAVDAPTGVEMDRGSLMGDAFRADLTVTFGLPKRGHFLFPGREYCGQLSIVDIGIPKKVIDESSISAAVVEWEDAHYFLPERPPDAHKGTCGTVLIISGSVGFTGAAALAGQAALLCGAGLVHLGVPQSLNDILEAKLTEVITKPLPETESRSLSIKALGKSLELAENASCVAIGPGLSQHPETKELVVELLKRVNRPIVLDADGINAISDDPGILAKRRWPTVITPHPGELGRLIGEAPADINSDRIEYASRWAEEWGVILLLKGAPTVISHPDGFTCINSTGNAGLASGGTGDVLTGAVSSLIAQGQSPFQSAVAASYFHGLAGDEAMAERGEMGLTATDVLDLLPFVLAGDLDIEDEDIE
ncbi:MAG: NAD(P)H-hydrate dehydratase [Candidatus Glassbacteria bacterium]